MRRLLSASGSITSIACIGLAVVAACREPDDDAAPGAADRPPNIVFFLVDDMGWMDSSVYGSEYYETPNLERLAEAGVTFTDAYSPSPLCSPARASLLTGKTPQRLGFTLPWGHRLPLPPGFPRYHPSTPADQPVRLPRSDTHLALEEVTIAERLREEGYRTAHVGKWHVGLEPPYWPTDQGFDVSFHGAPDEGPPSYFSPYGFQTGTVTDGPPGEYLCERVTDEALDFIEANRDAPFLLHLWHYSVHGPWGHRPELTERFVGKQDPRGEQENPIMASMLLSVDRSLGRVLDKLEELGLADDTVVVFTSDNGGNASDHTRAMDQLPTVTAAERASLEDWLRYAGHQAPTSNAPLREGKGYLYEGGTRVPLVISWPGVVRGGRRSSELVSGVDLFPTMLAMAGAEAVVDGAIDGVDLAPLLSGRVSELERDALFWHVPHDLPLRSPCSSVRRGDRKLIRWIDVDAGMPVRHELFDLANDLGETTNLAADRPDEVAELDAAARPPPRGRRSVRPAPEPGLRTP